ncbi:hypothetical protein [Rubritalea sp.]|uniref:hypothetical protein n=1 Tax=Rubritalea sp. TaxID=2109375 RepID=UPI003EF38939
MLIFETGIRGHRLEYINHVYHGFYDRESLSELKIVVPTDFNLSLGGLSWPRSEECTFYYLSEEEQANAQLAGWRGILQRRRILKKYVAKANDREVFLVFLVTYIPSIILMLGSARFSGVVYNIYTRSCGNGLSVLKGFLLFLLMRLHPSVDRIFLLNDQESCAAFNAKFDSRKFCYLADPFIPVSVDGGGDYELSRNMEVTTVLHFGGLCHRKGTMEVLKLAALLAAEGEGPRYRFIFAGKVYEDIKEEFYAHVEALSGQIDVQVIDRFCEYSYLGHLCEISDVLALPYKNVGQSSGLLGFAAQFNRPVMGPEEGLLGTLIREYELGYTLPEIDADGMRTLLLENEEGIKQWPEKSPSPYLQTHRPADFQNAILNSVGRHV